MDDKTRDQQSNAHDADKAPDKMSDKDRTMSDKVQEDAAKERSEKGGYQ